MGYELSTEQQFFVDLLRSRMSMRTQLASGSSMRLPGQLGNDELWEDFRLGLNYFNMFPPVITTYSSTDLYAGSANPASEDPQSALSTAVMMCAEFFVGIRLQWFEAGVHFEYNDNGISLMRKKQQDYASIANGSILSFINATVPILKKAIAFDRISPKGQFSGQVGFPRSLTRGLRGTRLGMGG
jgi:hypothetical protein